MAAIEEELEGENEDEESQQPMLKARAKPSPKAAKRPKAAAKEAEDGAAPKKSMLLPAQPKGQKASHSTASGGEKRGKKRDKASESTSSGVQGKPTSATKAGAAAKVKQERVEADDDDESSEDEDREKTEDVKPEKVMHRVLKNEKQENSKKEPPVVASQQPMSKKKKKLLDNVLSCAFPDCTVKWIHQGDDWGDFQTMVERNGSIIFVPVGPVCRSCKEAFLEGGYELDHVWKFYHCWQIWFCKPVLQPHS